MNGHGWHAGMGDLPNCTARDSDGEPAAHNHRPMHHLYGEAVEITRCDCGLLVLWCDDAQVGWSLPARAGEPGEPGGGT